MPVGSELLRSALQQRQLIGLAVPLGGIGQGLRLPLQELSSAHQASADTLAAVAQHLEEQSSRVESAA